ncbi:MAG: hypothetical protein ACPGYT_06535 [Nitrospirales bacterium]
MSDFILFMHGDAETDEKETRVDVWNRYIASLQAKGVFQGGSSIGAGICKNTSGSTKNITSHLVGYIRIRADSMSHAEACLPGNPVFEAGGTVEIRELPEE